MRSWFVIACLSTAGFCAGCGSAPSSKSPVALSGQAKQMGHAQGGQSPITGATIQLWQVNAIADGSLGTAMLFGTVTSSDGTGNAVNSNANAGNLFNTLPIGYFTITDAYTCPVGDALIYITASGGNPGLGTGTNNPQSQMVTALGSCNNLKNNVQFINISEQTTVATVAALYPFMSKYNAIGASPAHAPDIAAAFAQVNEYIDFQAGTAPGPALPAGYSASTGDLNLEANVLAACVNSPGGSYNDGTPCGNLFLQASASSSNPSTDVTAAALYIRENYSGFAGNIGLLATPQAPFQPASTTSPPDWSLPIFELPSTPTFSLSPGTYSGTQQVRILDADPSVSIYYAFNGATPSTFSLSYSGAITVSKSETINAIAVANRRVTSSVGSAAYTITGVPANVPTVSVTSPTVSAGSTAVFSILAESSVDGSLVTFGTSGAVGGSFSPATCTVSAGYCTVSYTPSGTAPAGTYTNDITASFTASGGDTAATATGTVFVLPAVTLTPLVAGDSLPTSLIQASDGNFYGIDLAGGGGPGSIFKMTSSGSVTTVYSFTGGTPYPNPYDRLVQGTDGSFYGVTITGGSSNNGSIFKVDLLGNYTLLYSFTGSIDGARPQRALVQGTDGSFYGTASSAGASGHGTIFKIDASGNFTLLHTFVEGTDGGTPLSGLVQGADGNFYGTTGGGGTYSFGTVFKMDLAGNVNTLYSFTGGADGTEPYAGLVQGADGAFYGTTLFGGTYSGGAVFKIDASGNFTALHSFSGSEGNRPQGALMEASDGTIYGTASYGSSGGSLFKVDLSGNYILVYDFSGGADGAAPDGSLVQGSDGGLYGTNSTGQGAGTRGGILFKLTPSPALAGPVTLGVPTAVTHGSSFTLTYTVSNASSQTMQQCFATNSAGDAIGWTGIKTASTSTTNATLTAPSTPGTYSYTLTCGGVESGFVTLNVN
jgi:uncharacterized repeat protein (TIGR03803 family)